MDVVFVRKFSDNAKLPYRATLSAVGYDLFSAVDATIPSMEQLLVPTDISITMPLGTYGRIASRYGLSVRNSIYVATGTIDRECNKNIHILLFNLSKKDFKINCGDSVAHIIFEKISQPIICLQPEFRVAKAVDTYKFDSTDSKL